MHKRRDYGGSIQLMIYVPFYQALHHELDLLHYCWLTYGAIQSLQCFRWLSINEHQSFYNVGIFKISTRPTTKQKKKQVKASL